MQTFVADVVQTVVAKAHVIGTRASLNSRQSHAALRRTASPRIAPSPIGPASAPHWPRPCAIRAQDIHRSPGEYILCLSYWDINNLIGDGHRILRDPRARVSHPPPNGPVHFVRRAICEGHDQAQAARLRGADGFGMPGRFARAMRRATGRIIRHRRDVSLGWISAAAALGIACGYYALCALGECLARVAPEAVRRHFAV